jgi:beta-lactamase regulating signal transducer with metallopeptidase domain
MLILNPVALAFAGQLGNCLAFGALILGLASLSSLLLRRASSSARFAVWFAALVAIAAAPLFSISRSFVAPSGFSSLKGVAAITLPASWALYFFIAWAGIAVISLARIVAGFCQVLALRRRSSPLDPATLAPELQNMLAQSLPSKSVAILLSDDISSPTAIGLLSPAIVLPAWLIRDLSSEELRQILLHELAHLRRRDDWSNLLQKIVKALFFFHPVVWWMERQLSLEREMACDEAVLAQTGNPRAYAQCLVLLAEKSFFRRSIMLAQAAVSRAGQTSMRVARILAGAGTRVTGMRKLVVPSFAAALMASIAVAAHAPRLIAFRANTHVESSVSAMASSPQLPGLAVMARADAAQSNRANQHFTVLSSSEPLPQAAARRTSLPDRPASLPTNVIQAKFRPDANRPASRKLQQDPSADFVVVVIESENDGNGSATPATWQVQMWHITVLRSIQNPAPQANPPKVI